jgi:transcriptional regulator with XRE-family HTH domain
LLHHAKYCNYLAYGENVVEVDYGRRFRELRKQRWRGTVLELAKRLGSPYPTTVYNIEREWRVPGLTTLEKHAAAIGCQPWELLEKVDTEFDRVRALERLAPEQALHEWRELLKRYRLSTRRGSKPDETASGRAPTRSKRGR